MSNDAVSNVVPLRTAERAGSSNAAQFERLLKECRDLACERLSQSLAGMLDKAADTLWGLSNAAQDRDLQRLYAQAKDNLVAQRETVEERFRSRYVAEFDNRAAPANKSKAAFSDYSSVSLDLGLVEDDDLNETLKTNDMAVRLRRYCEEELVALDQRTGVLLGDANPQADASPFSPHAICDAFKYTCRDVEPDVKLRMVYIKLFDDHVLDDVRSIYKAVNALLVENSILPKIRYSVSRRQDGDAGAAAVMAPGLGGAAVPAGVGTSAPGGEQDIFSVLQGLIAMNAGAMGAGAPGPAGAASLPADSSIQIPGFPPILGQVAGLAQPLLQGAALLGSLTRIQHGDLAAAGGALSVPAEGEAGRTNVLRELKGTSVGAGMGQMDVATLDIVAMLFDQIFEDRKIPDGMKWLIGRLQIPMLKVAILDKTFFSTRSHPARQMLDAFGEIALGLPADFGSASPLFQRVEAIVQKLVDGFQDSLDIFDTLRQELQDLVAEDEEHVREQTRNAQTRIEQKERLSVAKAVAQSEIKTRAHSGTMPKVLLEFLAQHWVKLLLLAHAKHGKDADAWKTAIDTMDQLIWSVSPKPSREERRKLAGLLPGLLKRVARGMQIVGAAEPVRARFFSELLKLHTEVMTGATARVAATEAGAAATSSEVISQATAADGAEAPPREAPRSPPKASAPAPAAPGSPPKASAPAPAAPGSPPKASAPAPAAPGSPPKVSAPAPAAPGSPPKVSAPAPSAPGSDQSAESEPQSGDESLLDFTVVTVKNPFGDGEVEVDEIELPRLPGVPAAAAKDGDEYSQLASNLKEGTWIEFRSEKERHLVKLSYVSTFKSTYLFVNRQGQTVGEYALFELAAELRKGRAVVVEEVPLVDRAMSSLMGALRGGTAS